MPNFSVVVLHTGKMFSVSNDEYTQSLLNDVQAKPVELSQAVPGRKMHLRSIATSLKAVHSDLGYVLDALDRHEGRDWEDVIDTIAVKLSRSTVILEGPLDGLVMASARSPTSNMSFYKTDLPTVEMLAVQQRLKSLKSFQRPGQQLWTDFWCVADYWKHYIPYQPFPVEFTGRWDFQVILSKSGRTSLGELKSGPLMHDLIVPVFNGAREILELLCKEFDDFDDKYIVQPLL